MNLLNKFLFYLRNRHIRKTREQIAYWSGKVEILQMILKRERMSYDRDDLIEARAKQMKYEARLNSLIKG